MKVNPKILREVAQFFEDGDDWFPSGICQQYHNLLNRKGKFVSFDNVHDTLLPLLKEAGATFNNVGYIKLPSNYSKTKQDSFRATLCLLLAEMLESESCGN